MKVQTTPTVPILNTTTKLSRLASNEEPLPLFPPPDPEPVDDGAPPPTELGTKVAEGLETQEAAAAPAAPDWLGAPVLMVAFPLK
jgi:hypothetical protein